MSDGHGGNLVALARQSGRPAETLLDFSANINPLGPPAVVRSAIEQALPLLTRYPDPACTELVAVIAEHLGVAPARIVVGNGSEQLIWWLPRIVAARRMLVTAPCYLDYRRSAELWRLPIAAVLLQARDQFHLDPERVARAALAGDLVWVGQPNNPTGRRVDSDALAQAVRTRPDVHWAIDEAFLDFVDDADSMVGRGLENLSVFRSLTKFFALPGLRLGFGVMAPVVATGFGDSLPVWSVGTLAQAVGTAVLKDPELGEFGRRTRELIRTERAWLIGELRGLGLEVVIGEANYLLLRLPQGVPEAVELADRLLREAGIAVRVCNDYVGLDARYLRVAVRQRPENQALVAALAARL
jgi:L-threonine-O-3-phosphate decarboxylase